MPITETTTTFPDICALHFQTRISKKPDGQGVKGLAWHHAHCFMNMSPSIQLDKISGWDSLSVSDQAPLIDLVKSVPSAAKNGIKSIVSSMFEKLERAPSCDSRFCLVLWLSS